MRLGFLLGLAVVLASPRAHAEADPVLRGMLFSRYTTVDKLGRTITYYVATPRSTSEALPLAVFVQGSGCDSQFMMRGNRIAGGIQNLLHAAVRGRARVMVVEKPGVSFLDESAHPGSAEGCSEEFLREHTLVRWAEAVSAALDAALALPRTDASHVLIVGHSEGGIVAARVAAENHHVTHVASLAGGGPSQLFDFVHGAGAHAIEVYLSWADIQRDPESIAKFWRGHPYRRWASFLASSPLDGLLRTDARIFLAHGTEDASVPVVSFDVARAELAARGKNVTVERIDGADHGFSTKAAKGGSRDELVTLLERVVDWFLK
jgi:dienelactone hydrolase